MSATTVLIVEDEEDIRELYADALSGVGLKVLKATNGEEGVEMALKHHPNVILMDIIMPIMGGNEAANKIRKDPWGKDARILFLTNMTDAENIVHAIEQKPEDYIIKSQTEIKELINIVRTIV